MTTEQQTAINEINDMIHDNAHDDMELVFYTIDEDGNETILED